MILARTCWIVRQYEVSASRYLWNVWHGQSVQSLACNFDNIGLVTRPDLNSSMGVVSCFPLTCLSHFRIAISSSRPCHTGSSVRDSFE